jgi:hypothetical protein
MKNLVFCEEASNWHANNLDLRLKSHLLAARVCSASQAAWANGSTPRDWLAYLGSADSALQSEGAIHAVRHWWGYTASFSCGIFDNISVQLFRVLISISLRPGSGAKHETDRNHNEAEVNE